MADPENNQIQLLPVSWLDPRAVALRELMDGEMKAIYGSLYSSSEPGDLVAARRRALAVDPRDILATLLALDPDGTPVAHVAARELRGEWEVKRLVVDSRARGRDLRDPPRRP